MELVLAEIWNHSNSILIFLSNIFFHIRKKKSVLTFSCGGSCKDSCNGCCLNWHWCRMKSLTDHYHCQSIFRERMNQTSWIHCDSCFRLFFHTRLGSVFTKRGVNCILTCAYVEQSFDLIWSEDLIVSLITYSSQHHDLGLQIVRK